MEKQDLKNFDAVVSMGGDGTNYEVLNGLLKFHKLDMEIDGTTITGENCFVEICNSR